MIDCVSKKEISNKCTFNTAVVDDIVLVMKRHII